MISLHALLGLLAPLPARFANERENTQEAKRRRAAAAARLPAHLRHDLGLDDMNTLADESRWRLNPNLER